MRNILTFALSAALMTMPNVTAAQPGGIPNSCDPEFHETLKQRAWLEGQREIEAAAALIVKPDSVLEYSCFEERIKHMGDASKDLFSDNTSGPHFKNEKFFPNDLYQPLFISPNGPVGQPGEPMVGRGYDLGNSTKVSLTNTNRLPLRRYLDANFGHPLDGGRYNGGTPLCNTMKVVWDHVRCRSFDKDTFKTLHDWAKSDPRQLPKPCTAAGRQSAWNRALKIAYPAPAEPPSQGGVQEVETFLDKLTQCSSAKAVPTGVIVTWKDGEDFEEKICSAPGCYYNGDGCQ
jgi:hypothetical protein